jgi:hypothetical protein
MANRISARIFGPEIRTIDEVNDMKNEIKGLLVGCGGAAALLFVAASPARAADPAPSTTTTTEHGTGPNGPTGTTTETTHATVTVAAIDKNARNLTVKTPDGDKTDIQVPADVKEFDKLKVGDKIDVDYTESLAVAMAPKGTKPSTNEKMTSGPGAAGHAVTVTAEVVKVDPANNKVTFKGPKGKKQTVTVQDPDMQARLRSLKPGQVFTFQYTEAVAAAIQPSK